MTDSDLQLLRSNVDKIVKIICTDGEKIVAKVQFVSAEDEDVIYDLVSTTRESQYEKHDDQPSYLIKFSDIEHVEPLNEGPKELPSITT